MFYQIGKNWIVNLLRVCDIGRQTDPRGEPMITITWETGKSDSYSFDSVELRDQAFNDIKDILVGSRREFIE